jgi:hypothetical protein
MYVQNLYKKIKFMNFVVCLELWMRFNEGDLRGSHIQHIRAKQIHKEFHM